MSEKNKFVRKLIFIEQTKQNGKCVSDRVYLYQTFSLIPQVLLSITPLALAAFAVRFDVFFYFALLALGFTILRDDLQEPFAGSQHL